MRMKEMTVHTVETGPHPEAMRREDLLQIAMLGALVASKELREQVEPEFFSDNSFRCAVSELKAPRTSGFKFLSDILRDYLGILWGPSDGPPMPVMIDGLEKNGHRQYVLDMLFKAADALETGFRTNTNLDTFFDAVKEAGHRANGWQQADPD
jgi:hypothetical protein